MHFLNSNLPLMKHSELLVVFEQKRVIRENETRSYRSFVYVGKPVAGRHSEVIKKSGTHKKMIFYF